MSIIMHLDEKGFNPGMQGKKYQESSSTIYYMNKLKNNIITEIEDKSNVLKLGSQL